MSDVYQQDTPAGAAGTAHSAAPSPEAPIASLLTGIVQDAQKLIGQQLDLLRQELKADLKRVAYSAALLSGGAVLLALSALLMVFMFVHLISWAFDLHPWVSYLIVGVGCLLIGGALLYWAISKLTSANPLPDQTLIALKENVQWKTNTTTNSPK